MGSRKAIFALALSVVALGCLVAAATASAVEWTIEEKSLTELSLEEESVKQTGGAMTLEGVIAGVSFAMTCESPESAEGTGKIQREGKGELTLTFSGCSVTAPTGCKAGTIKSNALKSEVVKIGNLAYDKLAPVSGELLMNVTLTECALKGTYPLKGTFPVELGQEASKLLVLTGKEVIEEAETGSVKLAGQKATLTAGAKLELSGGNEAKAFGTAITPWLTPNVKKVDFGTTDQKNGVTKTVTFTYQRKEQMAAKMTQAITNNKDVVFQPDGKPLGGTCPGAQLDNNLNQTCTSIVTFKPTAAKQGKETGTILLIEPSGLWFGLFSRYVEVPLEGVGT